MAELTIDQVANEVFKGHNTAMITMLNNSIKLAKNKHEKKAYKNVIDFIRNEDKKRIELFEKPDSKNEEKKESPIILLK